MLREKLFDEPSPKGSVLGVLSEGLVLEAGGFAQGGPDGREHELNKDRGFSGKVRAVDGVVVFLLPVVDDGFHREPGEQRIPLHEQARVP